MGNKGRPTPGTAAEARELIRELHEAEQSAHQALAEYKSFLLKEGNDVRASYDKKIETAVNDGLHEYRTKIGKQIEKDIAAISVMFDGIVKKILGEDTFTEMAHLPGVKDALVAIRLHQFRATGIADFTGLTDAALFEGMPEEVRRQLLAVTRAARKGANPNSQIRGVQVEYRQ